MRTILLTRAADGNFLIEKALSGRDFAFIHCPLIEYIDKDYDLDCLSDKKFIVITSKHAAIKLAELALDKSLWLLWVVGNISSEILRQAGFRVQYTAKNVEDLMANLPTKLYKQTIYLSSNEITNELPKEISRQIIYNVNYPKHLDSNQIEAIKEGIDYILLYSNNCAKTLINLLKQHDLLKVVENSIVIAVSLKVGQVAQACFENVLYCADEQHDKVIELLVNYEKTR